MYLLGHLLLGGTVVTSVIFLFISIISQVSQSHYLLLCITSISRPYYQWSNNSIPWATQWFASCTFWWLEAQCRLWAQSMLNYHISHVCELHYLYYYICWLPLWQNLTMPKIYSLHNMLNVHHRALPGWYKDLWSRLISGTSPNSVYIYFFSWRGYAR